MQRLLVGVLLAANAWAVQPCTKRGVINWDGGTSGNTPTATPLANSIHGLAGNVAFTQLNNLNSNKLKFNSAAAMPVYGQKNFCTGGLFTDTSGMGLVLDSNSNGATFTFLGLATNLGALTRYMVSSLLKHDFPSGGATLNCDCLTIYSTGNGFNNGILHWDGSVYHFTCEAGHYTDDISHTGQCTMSNQVLVPPNTAIHVKEEYNQHVRFRGWVYEDNPLKPGTPGKLLGTWSGVPDGTDGPPDRYYTGDNLGNSMATGSHIYYGSQVHCWDAECESDLHPDSYPYSGIIDLSRATDWSAIGAGTIPTNRTQCGSTIAAYMGTAAAINTALAACGANQKVLLGAGTFTLSTGITLSKDNVSLVGAGPHLTFVNFAQDADTNCSLRTGVCLSNTSRDVNFDNIASWTAGYLRGTTTITIGANTTGAVKPSAGTVIRLDQNSSATDTGDILDCTTTTTCTVAGQADPQRVQVELQTVVSISSGSCPCTVVITPGLRGSNWRTGQTPHASWSNQPYLTGAGIEDICFDFSADTNGYWGIAFFNVTNSWIARTCAHNAKSKNVMFYQSLNSTYRDNYQFGIQRSANGSDAYGFDSYFSGNVLVENNIFQRVTSPIVNENGFANVYGYNYSINHLNTADTTFATAMWDEHVGASGLSLFEGNSTGPCVEFENQYGESWMNTVFRNRCGGHETSTWTFQTPPIMIYARHRFHNIVGNVLGYSGYHTRYEANQGQGISQGNCNLSIYTIGMGDNCKAGAGAFPSDDSLSRTTVMRWCNWDTVNAATACSSGEVPSGLSLYANAVPTANTLPASFYLSAQPPWWGSMPWPAIGPDVSGGNAANIGGAGVAYKIPAQVCFESVMGGAYGDTSAKVFNPNVCYYGASAGSSSSGFTGGKANVGGGGVIH